MGATLTPTLETSVFGVSLSLEWHETGEGPPLLWLHGLHGYSPAEEATLRLAAHHRVLAPLHPGFGASARPKRLDSVSDLAFLYLELLEQLDLRDVTVVGSSLGGWIAAEMAVWRPGRIGRLVLVDPVGIRVGGFTDRDIADIWVLSREEQLALLFEDQTAAGPPITEVSEEEVLRRMRAEEAVAVYGWEPYLCNPRLLPRLGRIDLPTSVIWGANDRLVSLDYGRAYADAIPGAHLHVVEHAGHYPHLDQPASVCDVIEQFSEVNR
jgi:pimeloyl-ACP methyl ester carboxylesterase